uniref:Uncharacterized protein n=1 Tax=Opuntia streptacantha TaxID=393608 RepID=A0A7C9DQ07_OPUST
MPVVIQGAEKDEIVAVGNKVDSAGLRSTLTKKAGSAILMSVGEASQRIRSLERRKRRRRRQRWLRNQRLHCQHYQQQQYITTYTYYPAESSYLSANPQFQMRNYPPEDTSGSSIM